MLRRIRLHSRRLALGFLLFAILGFTTDLSLTARGVQWIGLLAAGITLFFALVIAVRPRSAVIVELFGMTLLLYQGFFALSPFLAQALSEASPIVRLGLLLMLYYLLFNIATSANGFRWPWTLGLRAHRIVPLSRTEVWRAMTPVPGRRHWDPDVASVEPAETGLKLNAMRRARLLSDGSIEMVVQEEAGRFRLSRRLPPDPNGIALTERLTLTHRRRGTQVELARVYGRLPMMTAMDLWLSGHPGELLDELAADLSGAGDAVPAEETDVQPGVPTRPTIS